MIDIILTIILAIFEIGSVVFIYKLSEIYICARKQQIKDEQERLEDKKEQ